MNEKERGKLSFLLYLQHDASRTWWCRDVCADVGFKRRGGWALCQLERRIAGGRAVRNPQEDSDVIAVHLECSRIQEVEAVLIPPSELRQRRVSFLFPHLRPFFFFPIAAATMVVRSSGTRTSSLPSLIPCPSPTGNSSGIIAQHQCPAGMASASRWAASSSNSTIMSTSGGNCSYQVAWISNAALVVGSVGPEYGDYSCQFESDPPTWHSAKAVTERHDAVLCSWSAKNCSAHSAFIRNAPSGNTKLGIAGFALNPYSGASHNSSYAFSWSGANPGGAKDPINAQLPFSSYFFHGARPSTVTAPAGAPTLSAWAHSGAAVATYKMEKVNIAEETSTVTSVVVANGSTSGTGNVTGASQTSSNSDSALSLNSSSQSLGTTSGSSQALNPPYGASQASQAPTSSSFSASSRTSAFPTVTSAAPAASSSSSGLTHVEEWGLGFAGVVILVLLVVSVAVCAAKRNATSQPSQPSQIQSQKMASLAKGKRRRAKSRKSKGVDDDAEERKHSPFY